MVLIARQPIDKHYRTLFFKCRLCGKAEQLVVTSSLEIDAAPHLR
jgi:hypothetical protein